MAIHATDTIPSLAPRYAAIITDNARRRRQQALGYDIANAALNGTDTTDLVVRLTAAAAGATDELALEDMAAALAAPAEDDMPTVLALDNGQHLLYPGAVNAISSEPGIGKSWLALAASAETITGGRHVLYVDYEDVPRRVARRLVTLGVPVADIIDRFHYLRPATLSPAAMLGLARRATALNVDLAVIDGVAAAMTAQGYDENEAADFYAWSLAIPEPLAATGAAVLTLDHVTKSKEGRGRYARGSGAKLAAITGAAYALEALESMSRHRPAKLKLTVQKDRHGHVGANGDIAAIVHLTPADDGESLTWTSQKPDTGAHGEWQGPTDCMATLTRLFTDIGPGVELGKSAIRPRLKATYGSGFSNQTIYTALEHLVLDGTLRGRDGARNGRYYQLNTDRPDHELDLQPAPYEEF